MQHGPYSPPNTTGGRQSKVLGLAVNQLSSDAEGSIPSPPTQSKRARLTNTVARP